MSGFIDADGSFSVRNSEINLEENKFKRQIACRLRLEQRKLDPITGESYFNILSSLAHFLGCKLLIRKQKSSPTNSEYYSIIATSKNSLNVIINYFDSHILFSSKYLDYLD